MSIGDAWKESMGSLAKEDAFKLLDAFYEAGGNFIDTASGYQNEQSEQWVGEWMKARGNRDKLVIATKYTTLYRSHELGKSIHTVNYGGNSKKTMKVSIRDSLAKLQTDYIDILYVHWWDWTSSIEEVMNGLHRYVEEGKVLYLGITDAPAWVVSAANTYAKAHAKTPFSIYQGKWSIMYRDFEREILPMARTFGMALAPWGVNGGGKLKTKKEVAERRQKGESLRQMVGDDFQTETEEKMSAALEKVAKELGVESITAVATAYVMQKAPYVFPIVGGRKIEHLHQNIEALNIHLSDEQVKELESVVPFSLGFPLEFIGSDPHYADQGFFISSQQQINWQKDGKPIGHQ
jgi:aryl-alcohol dehydrogenase-like predicted oxidoreductase